MSIWVCRKCNFTFSRVNEVEQCPDCGKTGYIEPATEQEEKDFLKNLEEMKNEKW